MELSFYCQKNSRFRYELVNPIDAAPLLEGCGHGADDGWWKTRLTQRGGGEGWPNASIADPTRMKQGQRQCQCIELHNNHVSTIGMWRTAAQRRYGERQDNEASLMRATTAKPTQRLCSEHRLDDEDPIPAWKTPPGQGGDPRMGQRE